MNFISLEKYLMGRIKPDELTEEMQANVNTLLPRVNQLLEMFGEYRGVLSGYRTPAINVAAGGKPESKHLVCAAIDLQDRDGKLKGWLRTNPDVLKDCDLYQEDPGSTPSWVHLQCIAPKSGRRVFYPS